MRIFLLSLMLLIFPAQAFACSCGSWQGGYVSEFSSRYVSFWAVPTAAKLGYVEDQRGSYAQIAYELVILEDFDRLNTNETTVVSSPVDGASCGVQLNIGTPHFLSAYRGRDNAMGISYCAPQLPYEAVKLYLETGDDTYIPSLNVCFSYPDTPEWSPPVLNADRKDCAVWENIELYENYYGGDDRRKYQKIWHQKNKEKK